MTEPTNAGPPNPAPNYQAPYYPCPTDPAPIPPSPAGSQPYPAYPPAQHSMTPPRGMLPWGLGFLGLIFLPFLNLIISGLVMTIVGLAQRRRGGLAAENGRRAANWGLTVLVITVPCTAIWIVALSIQAQGFFPWGISVIVWVLLGIANFVAAIVGLVQAGSSRAVRFPSIPFVR